MRTITIACAAAVAATAVPAAAADYITTVGATNPLAYFRLTAPGTPSTVGGYATSYSGAVTTGPGAPIAANPTNTGAVFAASDPNAQITTGLSGGVPGRGSINVWVNLSALPSALSRTFSLASEGQSGNDFDFQIQTDNRLYFYTGGGENTSAALAAGSLVGQWNMLTATYDGTLGANSFRNIYVNGALVGSFTGAVNATPKTSQFVIGNNLAFTGRALAGSIDEVAVWNYGLTDAQVATIYRSASDPGVVIGGVPEPATWATMIIGFGLVGGSLRRRRVRVACA